MLIIERRATANHAEYEPIFVHMGLFRRNGASKVGQNRRLGATTGRKTAPSAERIAGSLPGDDFYVSWGANGWRCSYSRTPTASIN